MGKKRRVLFPPSLGLFGAAAICLNCLSISFASAGLSGLTNFGEPTDFRRLAIKYPTDKIESRSSSSSAVEERFRAELTNFGEPTDFR